MGYLSEQRDGLSHFACNTTRTKKIFIYNIKKYHTWVVLAVLKLTFFKPRFPLKSGTGPCLEHRKGLPLTLNYGNWAFG